VKRPSVLIALTVGLVLGTSGPASATITPTSTSSDIATAIESLPALVTGSAFVTVPPSGTPNAVSDTALTGFPTDGATYGIMTSGNPTLADDANTSGSSGASLGGGSVRGGAGSDRDVSVLRVDILVPAGMNCLTVDFRFLSEEFPEYVGSSVNDGFIAELDTSDWTTEDDASISAPNNFAFDPNGDVISVNTSGATSMSSAEAAGTTYDGATPLLQAKTPITPGAHSVYLSIFDQGDQIYDSAAFIDNLTAGVAGEGACEPGAQPLELSISKGADEAVSEPEAQNGYTITIDNPNDEPVDIDSITDDLPEDFSYVDDSTTGDVTGNPTETNSGSTLTWQGDPLITVGANDSVSFHFDVLVSDTPGEYQNQASAQVGEGSFSTGPTATIEVQEPEEPPSIEKTADSSTTQAGGQNGYTITITNPTEVALGSITDTLPSGFSYVPASTTGLTIDDPAIDGQTLTWDGPFSQNEGSLLFDVTVSNTPGDYDNAASAQFGESTLDTGPTATITVTAAPVPPLPPPPPGPVSLPCDPITAEGGPGGDRMIGGIGADRIRALAGRDIVDTGAGDDEICGGDGGDFLYGRSGFDIIRGEGGNDRLYGGLHADTLYGDAGHDALIGGKGPDTFFTQDGVKDCIMTGKGKDTVHGDVGLDLVDPRGGCPPGFWL
jgi:uncharacterized repeat protein (TIGR01451 family)